MTTPRPRDLLRGDGKLQGRRGAFCVCKSLLGINHRGQSEKFAKTLSFSRLLDLRDSETAAFDWPAQAPDVLPYIFLSSCVCVSPPSLCSPETHHQPLQSPINLSGLFLPTSPQ